MACHLAMLAQYSLQVASTATAFSYSFIIFSQNRSRFNLGKEFFLGGMPLEPLASQANTLLNPPLHIFKFCCYGNAHNNYIYEIPNLKCKPATTLDLFLDLCLIDNLEDNGIRYYYIGCGLDLRVGELVVIKDIIMNHANAFFSNDNFLY